MPRKGCFYAPRAGGFLNKPTRETIDYSQFATKEWALLISFFRWYPDILEDICQGEHAEYANSLMNRVTKRYMARYRETFTFASRGYGKTTCIISDKCNKGILWPGEITGYYAPSETQAAPLASKAYATYERNTPLLARHWHVDSDAIQHFRVSTPRGSRFIMSIDRGIDTSGVVAEECAQEDRTPFNWSDFNQVVLGTNRLDHKVNGESDGTHVDSQIHYITSCSRKENESFQRCKDIRKAMNEGESAYALFIPWQVPVLCRMKRLSYYTMLKRNLTADQFMRECESKCTGSVEDPIIKDSVLQAARTVKVMEDRHCGDPNTFYVLGYDVSSRDHSGNALSAFAAIKCERQREKARIDHYKKSLVYVNDMHPPKTAREHAVLIKRRWREYSIKGQTAYVIVDARNYGQSVIEHLHEDLGDGLPPFRTINDDPDYAELVQPAALPVLYAIQAGGNTGRDPNSEMLDYMEREFENGNLRILTANIHEGTRAYKLRHNMKDDTQDIRVQYPYLKTRELCRQIGNLKKKYTSTGWIEAPISRYIIRDMWSATLYAGRLCQRLEKTELYLANRADGQWEKEAKRMTAAAQTQSAYVVPTRANRRMGRMAIKR